MYGIYPVHFFSASSLAWQSAFKKTNVELQLLDNIGLMLVIKKVSVVKYLMLFMKMQKLIKNTRKTMINIKDRHILFIVTWITYMDGQCHKSYL